MFILLIIFIFNKFNVANSVYIKDEDQTLSINYYDSYNCTGKFTSKVYTYNTCRNDFNNYDDCCNFLLKKYEIIPKQNTKLCYNKINDNTTKSYLYECSHNGSFSHMPISILLLLFPLIICFIIILLYLSSLKQKNKNYYYLSGVGMVYDYGATTIQ